MQGNRQCRETQSNATQIRAMQGRCEVALSNAKRHKAAQSDAYQCIATQGSDIAMQCNTITMQRGNSISSAMP
eukprot:5819574-Pyramimonas_sp.AAC.1